MTSRIQLALNVRDVESATTFYADMFGVPPAKQRPGYANFVVADSTSRTLSASWMRLVIGLPSGSVPRPVRRAALVDEPAGRGTQAPTPSSQHGCVLCDRHRLYDGQTRRIGDDERSE